MEHEIQANLLMASMGILLLFKALSKRKFHNSSRYQGLHFQNNLSFSSTHGEIVNKQNEIRVRVDQKNTLKMTSIQPKLNVEAKIPLGPLADQLEQFELKAGVMVSEGGRIKEGPPLENNKNYDFMSLTTSNIRMTKQNYLMLTRAGNLSRSHLNKTVGGNEEELAATISAFDSHGMPDYGETIKSQGDPFVGQNQFNINHNKNPSHYGKSFKSLQNTSDRKFEDSIKIGNSKNYEFLFQIPKKEETKSTIKLPKLKNLEPIDAISEQNLMILKNSNWGKDMTNKRFLGDKINHTKQSRFSQIRSLGNLKKAPRLRDLGPRLKERLPPPRIGSSFGHGFPSLKYLEVEALEDQNKGNRSQ